jgi:hypothetical protein
MPARLKQQLVKQICTELIVHTELEEEIFYPACREKQVDDDSLDEAQVEHDSAKILIGELMSQSPDSQFYDAKVSVLSEYIKHHVGEEEKPSDGIFARARTAAVDMNALGQRLQARRQELLSKAETQGFRPPQPRALELSHFERRNIQEYQAMDRRFDRDRDEQGRFTAMTTIATTADIRHAPAVTTTTGAVPALAAATTTGATGTTVAAAHAPMNATAMSTAASRATTIVVTTTADARRARTIANATSPVAS